MNDQNFDTTGDDSPDTTPTEGAPAADRIPTDGRPLGFWLRAVDALLTREFDAAFAEEGVTRRDWMLLNALSGDTDPALAERLARRPKRLRVLEKRGWAEETGDGTWVLTAEGRAARERLAGVVDGIRRRVAESVPAEDFATTLASLEAIARELGWDEAASSHEHGGFFGPRGERGRGFGFRPGFGAGHPGFPGFPGFSGSPGLRGGPAAREGYGHFGPGFRPGFDPRRAWAWGWDEEDGCRGHGHRAHSHHDHHSHHGDPGHHGRHGRAGHGHGHHGERVHDRHHGGHDRGTAEEAYERGFDAGYTRAAERA
jgi:hypothetical protein